MTEYHLTFEKPGSYIIFDLLETKKKGENTVTLGDKTYVFTIHEGDAEAIQALFDEANKQQIQTPQDLPKITEICKDGVTIAIRHVVREILPLEESFISAVA